MSNIELVKVTNEKDVLKYGLGCLTNQTHPGFQSKLNWLKNEFANGLTIIILRVDGKSAGMIEYTTGKNYWRPVNANNYLMIHCLWITHSKYHGKEYGKKLINVCLEDAKRKNVNGVGVVTSDGPWMADKRIFIKNSFKEIESKERFELLVKKFKNGKLPSFIDWDNNQINSKGFKIEYANQCPMFAKCIPDMQSVVKNKDLSIDISELKSSEAARKAPSGYGVMNVLSNGIVVADHYISGKRFENILNNE
ncbi:GNAT family N-acetyltransferase [Bacteroidota bacterium]